MATACLSAVSLNEIAWVFSRFLCLNTLDFGGQDLAGGLGGGRNNPPSRLSFFVERVSGSSWKRGLGRQVLEETLGGGFTGVANIGVDEDKGWLLLGGVCGLLLLNIFLKIYLKIYILEFVPLLVNRTQLHVSLQLTLKLLVCRNYYSKVNIVLVWFKLKLSYR